MSKKFGAIVIGMILLALFLTSVASAQTTGEFSKQGAEYMDAGIVLNTVMYDSVKLGKSFDIYMVPYETSGKTLDNTTTICSFGMRNPDGKRLLVKSDAYGDFEHIGGSTWTTTIPADFINETGSYAYSWDCQGTLRGGYFNGILYVTATGTSLTSGKAILFSFILLLSIGIFLGFIWFGGNIKTDYPKDARTGYIIGLNNAKYLKYLMYALSYVNLLWITYFMWMITYAYLDFNFMATIFRFIFTFLAVLTLPLFMFYIWIQIANLIKDSKMREALSLGALKDE